MLSDARKRFTPLTDFVEFREEETEQSIASRLEEQVRRVPQHIAVQTAAESLTYDAFNRRVNRLAHTILALRGEESEPVVVLCSEAAQTVVALMAVLKSGKFYAPLDPAYPEAWLLLMCSDVQPALIICDDEQAALAARLNQGGCPLLNLNDLAPGAPDSNPALRISPDTPSNLTYTAGSSGAPKSVLNNQRHALLSARIEAHLTYLTPADRAALLASVSQANSRANIFNALMNGVALCPYDVKRHGVGGLADWLRRERITTYKSVPSLFRHMAEALQPDEAFPHLRVVILVGEPITKRDLELFKQHFAAYGGLRLSYGTTEASGIGLALLDKHDLAGRYLPLTFEDNPGKQVMFWDEHDRAVGVNEVGEIVVKSGSLGEGYWRKPELTAKVFLPDPAGGPEKLYRTGDLGRRLPDGRFEVLGRKDAQVKIRGFRIEPSQIENVLLELEAMQEVVVVARPDARGEKQLVAYYVAHAGTRYSVGELRAHLTRLPDYMLPSYFVRLTAMPSTPSGKLDRSALPPPPLARPELAMPFVAPRTAVEQALAAIWKGVLRLDEIGVHDPFLELGGDSLRAMQIIARVLKVFGVALPARALYDSATPAAMAAVIARHQSTALNHQELESALSALEALTDEEARRMLSVTA